MAKKLRVEDITFDMVRYSIMGCNNCLYQSCECTPVGKNFIPHVSAYGKHASCKNYAYYD